MGKKGENPDKTGKHDTTNLFRRSYPGLMPISRRSNFPSSAPKQRIGSAQLNEFWCHVLRI
jgi:hypothetical protein